MNTHNRNIRRYFLYAMLLCLLVMSLVSCGGGGGSSGNDYTPPQPTVGVPHDILLSSDRTVGQSNSPIYMTALVTDVNGRPVKNTEVTFTKTSTAGNISPSLLNDFAVKDVSVYKVQTDVYGRASIKVNS
ncbi:secreted protein containing Bacterial Ig-like, group 1 domain protein, partial [Candidatus Magnetobacterium bavaricum]